MDITIKDLGTEAIDELLAEASDGMRRWTGKRFTLELDLIHGDLKIHRDGKHVSTTNVRPPSFLQYVRTEPGTALGEVPSDAALVMRFRSNLRRKLLEATQAITPVPGASDVPAALVRAFNAISALELVQKELGAEATKALFGVGHDLWRIVDHLTGNDHSGCSGAPSVSDYGRGGRGGTAQDVFDKNRVFPPVPKGRPMMEVTTGADGVQRVRTRGA